MFSGFAPFREVVRFFCNKLMSAGDQASREHSSLRTEDGMDLLRSCFKNCKGPSPLITTIAFDDKVKEYPKPVDNEIIQSDCRQSSATTKFVAILCKWCDDHDIYRKRFARMSQAIWIQRPTCCGIANYGTILLHRYCTKYHEWCHQGKHSRQVCFFSKHYCFVPCPEEGSIRG
jgi:hypothetical protein